MKVIRHVGFPPDVKRLVNHQDAEPVASVQKGLGGWIVAGADRVVTIGLENFQAALLGAVEGGRAEQTIVMVDAAAAKFGRHPIEQQPFFRAEFQRADAKDRLGRVHQTAVFPDFRPGLVEGRRSI